MELHYEEGALLPRQNGKSTSRVEFIEKRIKDMMIQTGFYSDYKIVFVVSKIHLGHMMLKDIKHIDKVVVVSSVLSLKDQLIAVKVYDVVIDAFDLTSGKNLTLNFG